MEIETMKAVVEEYIYKMTNRKVKIVLDNPMSMRKHFVLLSEAYSYALMYNNNENKS